MYSFFNILLSLLVYLPGNAVMNFSELAASDKRDSLMPVPAKTNTVLDYGKADVTSLLSIDAIVRSNVAAKGTLGFSQKGRMIEAWYFPGTSNKKALVIGGVHGSELSSIEVARTLIKQLQQQKNYYSVVVIPCLFPDNAEAAKADAAAIGSMNNTGRYSHQTAPDPNRQMPSLGKAFNPDQPVDHLGRLIEQENQLLLDLITQFSPERIVNIHAIRDLTHAGVYADPRTNSRGIALGFESDSSLAVGMAAYIHQGGGYVPGNKIAANASALYYKDPVAAPAGTMQKRNTAGSSLPMNRGRGISLGSWASTAVEDDVYPAGNREAIRLITMEFPGYKAPMHYADPMQQQHFGKQVKLYASSIFQVFLGDQYAEDVTKNISQRQ
ncbi:MAG: hypothetical protein WCF67_07570 [Chitinophagaceae bacterium]